MPPPASLPHLLEELLDHLGVRVDDVLPLDVLDEVELLQGRDDVLGLDGRHLAQILHAHRTLEDKEGSPQHD